MLVLLVQWWSKMRATPKRFIKSLFLISVTGFLIVNMNLLLRTSMTPDYDEEGDPGPSEIREGDLSKIRDGGEGGGAQGGHLPNRTGDFHSKALLNQDNDTDVGKLSNESKISIHANRTMGETRPRDALRVEPPVTDIETIKTRIAELNAAQKILNLDKFDLSSSENTIVIVVQVHNRANYLKHLIDSLRKAEHIEQALLIFSHDLYDNDINELVAKVDFCPVLQIFYPYPMQLYPKVFPGEDPGDCPRDIDKQEALKRGCTNAEHPDKYGHYREAFITQTKHHWFWKINHVFDYLDVTRNFNGPVLFLEEDHYVVEDFIPLLKKMYRFREQACKDCDILTIGNYDKKPTYGAFAQRVEILPWISSKHNMGMSMNRQVWQKVKKCSREFCTFDDYNWDWSLQYISQTCIPNKLKAMLAKSPRTYHIGECGVHHKGKNCNPVQKVQQIETILSANRQHLFPQTLMVHGYPKVPNKATKANGGWGDTRDHEFCLSFGRGETHPR